MLERLKSLFGGKKEPEEVSLQFKEVEAWLADMSLEKRKSFDKESAAVLDAITRTIENCEEQLDVLKDATLRNENLPQRAIQIMQGNRESYIFNTKKFLEKIDPDTYKPEELAAVFKAEVVKLAETNKKSGLVMKEFFGNESLAISNSIKDMESSVKSIEKLMVDSGMNEMEKLKKEYASLNSRIENKQRLALEMDELLSKKKASIDKKEKIEKTIQKLKQAKDYANIEELRAKKRKYKDEHKRIAGTVAAHFSSIEPALKKYGRISLNDTVIKAYLKDSPKALVNDESLSIVPVLESLRKQLDKLDLKDKKKEKMTENLDKIDLEQLKAERDRLLQLEDMTKEIGETINSSGILHDFNEEEYRLKHIEEKLKSIEVSISDLEKSQEKAEEADIPAFAEHASKALGMKITIS